MSLDWDGVAEDVLAALQELGQDVVLRRTSDAGYNLSTSSADANSEDLVRRAAVLPFAAGESSVRGALVLSNDRRCVMDAAGPSPSASDEVVVGGLAYSIISTAEIAPGGVSVANDLHLRAN